MKLRLRHIVALHDEGLDIRNYELIGESAYDFKFRNKGVESRKCGFHTLS